MPNRRLIQCGDEQNRKRRDYSHRPNQCYYVFSMVSTGSWFQRPHNCYVPVDADGHQRVRTHLHKTHNG